MEIRIFADMPNVFISYSRKDTQQALTIAERLRTEGLSVWIDQHGIGAAEQWATKIASSIRECSSFLLLLSPASIVSENVLKELSLASEKSKRIVPVDISGQIALPVSFEYALAGIQRVDFGNFDAVLEAIRIGPKRNTIKDSRKSLMILPFEDLSPTHDNEWFADGLVSELIDTLSVIKSLRLIDRKTSFEYKSIRARTTEIARELGVRYFIDGNVRKFGEQVKISIQLLDIEEGEYLWTDAHKGEFKDIFAIQEEVAKKVVDGLKLKLTTKEQEHLEERGTENVQAYELFLKARESFDHGTRQSYLECIRFAKEASALDPGFVSPRGILGQALLTLYRFYGHNPDLLQEAEEQINYLLLTAPDFLPSYNMLSTLQLCRGKLKEAEDAALHLVQRAPERFFSYGTLALFYMETGQWEKAIVAFERELILQPDRYTTYWNLILCCDRSNDREHMAKWLPIALFHYKQRLERTPSDNRSLIQYAILLYFAGETGQACEMLKPFDIRTNVDTGFLFDIACLYARLDQSDKAVEYLTRAAEAGSTDSKALLEDTDLASLRAHPEFQQILQRMKANESRG